MSRETIKCVSCENKGQTMAQLKKHIKYHDEAAAYKCNNCQELPRNSINFRILTSKHMVVHANNGDIKCEECNKSIKAKRKIRYEKKARRI